MLYHSMMRVRPPHVDYILTCILALLGDSISQLKRTTSGCLEYNPGLFFCGPRTVTRRSRNSAFRSFSRDQAIPMKQNCHLTMSQQGLGGLHLSQELLLCFRLYASAATVSSSSLMPESAVEYRYTNARAHTSSLPIV
ncbi:hypothetical protein BDR06DRAFT_457775 [Suillus hirtellus]|nr:hypothetical protein BDR06DRAFT_457775 [Suillus hirtellus]